MPVYSLRKALYYDQVEGSCPAPTVNFHFCLVQRQVDFFIQAAVNPRKTKLLHGHGAGEMEGQTEVQHPLGTVRSNTVSSGNRAL